jgi:hypothetical protein
MYCVSYEVRTEFIYVMKKKVDRFCGLVVRVPGYRFRGPGSIPDITQIFWEVVGLEPGPLSRGRSIGIVGSPTEATELSKYFV